MKFAFALAVSRNAPLLCLLSTWKKDPNAHEQIGTVNVCIVGLCFL